MVLIPIADFLGKLALEDWVAIVLWVVLTEVKLLVIDV